MRARITFVVEFEMNPDHYEAGATPEQMLAVEVDNANNDPELFMDDLGDMTITGELVDGVS